MAGSKTHAGRSLSRRLLAYEAESGKLTFDPPLVVFRVCDKLRTPLTRLMGTSGFRSLLSRAVAVAAKKSPWLQDVRVTTEGAVTGPDETMKALSVKAFAAGEAAVTAEFLDLLVTFIGPEVTMRLLQDTWPKFGQSGF